MNLTVNYLRNLERRAKKTNGGRYYMIHPVYNNRGEVTKIISEGLPKFLEVITDIERMRTVARERSITLIEMPIIEGMEQYLYMEYDGKDRIDD
ncbi:hypothetical protein ABE30_27520 [Bacillus tropicus]|uniref:hypothetical protein n=1 Tax=Bacillus cereus group TaxID=86661 RepID=UPI000B44C0EA|nr:MULTISPECIES: hypothetical protein [Bacillus cereus group]MBG9841233.1 hypothetical protein [Bacillus tropicus]MBG9876679.1 hypothetical protein [Bacillus tropicus]OTY94982.1 hypothetical protein BK755_00280 [Bacillus thuringiensis serovar aizawai]